VFKRQEGYGSVALRRGESEGRGPRAPGPETREGCGSVAPPVIKRQEGYGSVALLFWEPKSRGPRAPGPDTFGGGGAVDP
jgi:hypothetical protein